MMRQLITVNNKDYLVDKSISNKSYGELIQLETINGEIIHFIILTDSHKEKFITSLNNNLLDENNINIKRMYHVRMATATLIVDSINEYWGWINNGKNKYNNFNIYIQYEIYKNVLKINTSATNTLINFYHIKLQPNKTSIFNIIKII